MIWAIIASLVVLLIVAYMVYSLPEEIALNRKKKEKKERVGVPVVVVDEKNWKEIAGRWEKNNNALLGDLEKIKQEEKKFLRNIEDEKKISADLKDKLALEKGWREKEQANLDKFKAHEKDLKDQIIRTEKDLEREHSNRLRLERELQELKVKYDAVSEEKRASSTKAMSLESTVSQMGKDLKALRIENEELKKKREDIQWVAKSEYDQLLKEFNKLKQ